MTLSHLGWALQGGFLKGVFWAHFYLTWSLTRCKPPLLRRGRRIGSLKHCQRLRPPWSRRLGAFLLACNRWQLTWWLWGNPLALCSEPSGMPSNNIAVPSFVNTFRAPNMSLATSCSNIASSLAAPLRGIGSLLPLAPLLSSPLDQPFVVGSPVPGKLVTGPFARPPLPNLEVSSFGVIPKKGQPGKWRLIVDLSSPLGG